MSKTVVYVAAAVVFLGIGALVAGISIWYAHPDIVRSQMSSEVSPSASTAVLQASCRIQLLSASPPSESCLHGLASLLRILTTSYYIIHDGHTYFSVTGLSMSCGHCNGACREKGGLHDNFHSCKKKQPILCTVSAAGSELCVGRSSVKLSIFLYIFIVTSNKTKQTLHS